MKLRSSDPAYLRHVDRWWGQLFARLRPHLAAAGGPVIMLQIENEYGFCGAALHSTSARSRKLSLFRREKHLEIASFPPRPAPPPAGSDKVYLRHLAATARAHLGDDLILYTTDPAHVAAAGTLPGDEVLTTVDFGPAWFYADQFFEVQKSLNAPGKSPPMCSEFYTGWLTHWGEAMANTTAELLANDTTALLRFANGTGNLNFYMVGERVRAVCSKRMSGAEC
jgi:beta-galactosidase